MNWSLIAEKLEIGVLWAFSNGILFAVSLCGAVTSYFLYKFPEIARIRTVLASLVPNAKGASAARLNFLVTTFLGTFVATFVLQPATYKEAFLAGFVWLGVLRHYHQGAKTGTKGDK